jgi:hypothetical protein
VLALDGVVSGDVEDGVRFHEATGLEARDARALARTVQLRVLRWFVRRGLLDPSTAADPYAPPPHWKSLILRLPSQKGARAFPVSIPPEPSAAQRATLDLLVKGKLQLGSQIVRVEASPRP